MAKKKAKHKKTPAKADDADRALDAPETDFYVLVSKFCTLEAIQELLRRHQQEVPKDQRSDVKISGENKADITTVNLKTAVEKGHIPITEVRELLQDAEENGRQHIFLYKPRNAEIRAYCQNGNAVAEALFGKEWRDTQNFPKFDLIPDKYLWGDFRVGLPGKPQDWVAKLYGHEESVEFIGKEEREGDEFAKVYKRRKVRTICMVRWNNPDILEVRVPATTSRKAVTRRRDLLWVTIQRGVNRGDFSTWPLNKVRMAMLRAEEKAISAVAAKEKGAKLETFDTGDKQFIDEESNVATFSMQFADEEESPTIAESTHAATTAYLDNECECQRLVAYWKDDDKEPTNPLKRTLRTLLGTKDYTNEFIVFSRVNAKTLDYVINQLRRFTS